MGPLSWRRRFSKTFLCYERLTSSYKGENSVRLRVYRRESVDPVKPCVTGLREKRPQTLTTYYRIGGEWTVHSPSVFWNPMNNEKTT